MTKDIPSFSIQELFEKNDSYVIPIYQRNYTWGQGEIAQLIQDVYDFAFDNNKHNNNYYIGTLIVYERHLDNKIVYETIDGQQRLTTLNILLNAIHRVFKKHLKYTIEYNLELSFDSRKKSTDTLAVINGVDRDILFNSNKEYNSHIKQRYFDAETILKRFLNTPVKANIFYNYLVKNVRIVRASVPEETDLNHYFEIMNNRGEQLEKHEILKAKMLAILKDDIKLSYTFNLIWEACSDMERYVQYGFSVTQRDNVFNAENWNVLNCSNLDEIALRVFPYASRENLDEQLTVQEIIDFKGSFEINQNHTDEAPERFNSVINFSNFLLHVLRIQIQKNVSLDDKRLLDFFDEIIKSSDDQKKIEFVKQFGFSLLKSKHLFDQYIIKREFIRDKDQWSLKKLKLYKGNKISYVNVFEENESSNREILMLLAMFHVSTPTLVYKHWLNAALYYLFYEDKIDLLAYKRHLQAIAEAYLFDRYVGNEIDYFDIIYKNKGISINKISGDYDLRHLDKGTAVENFVFNYLDYILWKENGERTDFEFTFRSSVEHYYPQNPISSDHKIDSSIYDLFGNLCLISSSKNSRLSNHMPMAKKDYYHKVGADSLKQELMMKEPNWSENEIHKHSETMKYKLENFVDYALKN